MSNIVQVYEAYRQGRRTTNEVSVLTGLSINMVAAYTSRLVQRGLLRKNGMAKRWSKRGGTPASFVPTTRYVSAEKTRRHILALGRKGIGRQAISDAAGVGVAAVQRIRAGRLTKIRRSTEDKILFVDEAAIADGALVPAKETWKLLGELIADGYTKKQLAQWMGFLNRLQISPERVQARTALKVKRLYFRIQNGQLQRAA